MAQGGDLGAGVTTHMGRLKLEGLAAIHLNFPTLFPPPVEGEPDAKEKAALGQLMRFRDKVGLFPDPKNTTANARLRADGSADRTGRLDL